jgi:hypothetical protein
MHPRSRQLGLVHPKLPSPCARSRKRRHNEKRSTKRSLLPPLAKPPLPQLVHGPKPLRRPPPKSSMSNQLLLHLQRSPCVTSRYGFVHLWPLSLSSPRCRKLLCPFAFRRTCAQKEEAQNAAPVTQQALPGTVNLSGAWASRASTSKPATKPSVAPHPVSASVSTTAKAGYVGAGVSYSARAGCVPNVLLCLAVDTAVSYSGTTRRHRLLLPP